jgi:predicted solute-binding protein
MLHGDQRGLFDLSFTVPSECADRIAAGVADIGIVPSVELPRLGLSYLPGTGIASRGAVRSLLLISKAPFGEIRRIAADVSSRTTIALTQILLARQYRNSPEFVSMPPDLEKMLSAADAAIIIGDPALRLDIDTLPYRIADVGEQWTSMKGLPMVYAVWGGRPGILNEDLARLFRASCRFGIEHLDDIVEQESRKRGIPEELAHRYLTRHIVNELGEREYEGLRAFLSYTASDIVISSDLVRS